MQPLILRQATPVARNENWRDDQTDTDPLPATVMTSVNGTTTAPQGTRITEVLHETTDDK